MSDTLLADMPAATELLGSVDVERLDAASVIDVAIDRLHPNIALACSFQKEESVIVDLLMKREPNARIFALDTHVLFPETYALWRVLEQRYGTRIEVFEGPSLGRQAATHGDRLWETNPDLCCAVRKLAPLATALAGLDGWIVGVRRDQSPTRAQTPKLGWDERNGLWKVSPLADWTDADVWAYIDEHDLPVNPLHRRGYASIGCTHCTRPGDGRDGRWTGNDKSECGLHA